ncbi:hypothetical protein ABH942_001723 [Flavobacterium sp. 28YEA47A]|uniref:SMI1/KNR4 family protein n=1 Tax=Flavobacterium sp. 28YEA47A TaxID=3156276 RepID=UPI0035118238
MEIEYLTDLQDFAFIEYDGAIKTNEPISIEEILELEKQFNDGKMFPKALRELLFLAGNSCKLLDYSIFNSQQELQESIIEDLKNDGLEMKRPYYTLEVYDGGSPFYFVYLDEGDNPMVYVAKNEYEELELIKIADSLSAFLSNLIKSHKEDVERRNDYLKFLEDEKERDSQKTPKTVYSIIKKWVKNIFNKKS